MCSLFVYLSLSDHSEKCDDIREVAWSSGECANHCLMLSVLLPNICLKCQYFPGIWTTGVHMYDVMVSRHLWGEGQNGKNNKIFQVLNILLFKQNEEPLYSRDHMTFFITVPLKHSDSGTFSHITMISNRVRLLQTLFSWDFVALTNEWKSTLLMMNKSMCSHGLEYPGYYSIISGLFLSLQT